MEMNSHQKVPASQTVANTQPRQTAWPTRVAYCSASTSRDSETICQSPLGWPAVVPGSSQPGSGQAMDAACSRPPNTQSANQARPLPRAARPGGRRLMGLKLEGVWREPNKLRMGSTGFRLRPATPA